ncbi:MAG TPA: hypothetical protein VIF15_18165, partial [Polyangiaceae bacterium]
MGMLARGGRGGRALPAFGFGKEIEMQKMKWVRFGLAAALVAGGLGGVSAAGCSADDTGTTTGKDAAPDNSVVETGGGDTGTGGDGGGGEAEAAAPIKARVFLAHAAVSPLSPPFRFCFGLGDASDGGTVTVAGGIFPFPDTKTAPSFPVAGLFPGFGGSTGNSAQLASFDLKTLTISIYVLNALAPAVAGDTPDGGPDGGAELPCEGLVGPDGKGTAGSGPALLKEGTDFWYVGTIPQGQLADGTTWLAAVTGCPPGETPQQGAFCAPAATPYDPATGNLALKVWKLDQSPMDAGSIGAQVAHGSPAWDTVVAVEHGANTSAGFYTYTTPANDGGGGDGAAEAGDDGGGDAATDGAAADGGGSEGGATGPVFTPNPIVGATPFAFGDLAPVPLASVTGVTYDMANGFYAAIIDGTGKPVGPPL